MEYSVYILCIVCVHFVDIVWIVCSHGVCIVHMIFHCFLVGFWNLSAGHSCYIQFLKWKQVATTRGLIGTNRSLLFFLFANRSLEFMTTYVCTCCASGLCIFCVYFGNIVVYFVNILRIFWIYSGYILCVICKYSRNILGTFCAYSGNILRWG